MTREWGYSLQTNRSEDQGSDGLQTIEGRRSLIAGKRKAEKNKLKKHKASERAYIHAVRKQGQIDIRFNQRTCAAGNVIRTMDGVKGCRDRSHGESWPWPDAGAYLR